MSEKVELSAALEKAETERDELAAKVEKFEAEAAELATKVAELEKAAETVVEPVEPVAIDKNELSPAVREALEKAEARAAAADERIEKAESIAKQEQDLRVTREFVAKAELIPNVAGDTKSFGPVLKAASEALSPEHYALLEERLDAANEQINKGELFTQLGKSGDGKRGTGADEIARNADELRKADNSLSGFQAMRRAARTPEGERYLQNVR